MSRMDIRPPCIQSTRREQGLLVAGGGEQDGVYSLELVELNFHIRQTAATLYLNYDQIPGPFDWACRGIAARPPNNKEKISDLIELLSFLFGVPPDVPS